MIRRCVQNKVDFLFIFLEKNIRKSKMLKAYKYRLYPNKEQTELLNKHIGCCRFIWNWALDKKTKTYQETAKSISRFDLQSLLPFMKKEEAFLWLKEVNSLSLQATLEILEKSFTGFFRDKKGYPKLQKQKKRKPKLFDSTKHKSGF